MKGKQDPGGSSHGNDPPGGQAPHSMNPMASTPVQRPYPPYVFTPRQLEVLKAQINRFRSLAQRLDRADADRAAYVSRREANAAARASSMNMGQMASLPGGASAGGPSTAAAMAAAGKKNLQLPGTPQQSPRGGRWANGAPVTATPPNLRPWSSPRTGPLAPVAALGPSPPGTMTPSAAQGLPSPPLGAGGINTPLRPTQPGSTPRTMVPGEPARAGGRISATMLAKGLAAGSA
ncbi:unnamed protein product, partial [Discosporangium mesarthrocarpum]